MPEVKSPPEVKGGGASGEGGSAMTFEEFKRADPGSLPGALQALWLAENGAWEQAHTVAQAADGPDGAWVHAYLHRREGDAVNARYWYRQAGRPAATGEPADEWKAMVEALLGDDPVPVPGLGR